MRRLRGGLGVAACCVLVLAPFLAHSAIATGRFASLAVAAAVVQAAGIATLALRTAMGPAKILGLIAAGLLLVRLAAQVLSSGPQTPALIATSGASHAILYGGLLILFATSLRRGGVDLVTGMAMRFDDARTPEKRRYTRRVTWAWCGFFAAQLAMSMVLLAAAPHWVWSLFVNVLDAPLVVVMFSAEYLVRRLRFRREPHVTPLQIWRSYTGRANVRAG